MAFALVTGSAKGIGKSIATELAKKGYHLFLTDIDEKSLAETATQLSVEYKVGVYHLVKDLAEPDAAQVLYNWTATHHGQLNVLVSNAGYGLTGYFDQLPLDQQLGIIDVNIKATVALTYTFLPLLKEKSESYLLITGSTTAYQSVPYLTVYAASKAFILSFTRSISYELKNSTVTVSCLVPGPTDTAWVQRAGIGKHTLKTADIFNMTPDEVGKIAVHGLFKGKRENIAGLVNKLNAFFPKFFPKRFVEKIGAGIYDPAKNKKLESTNTLHSKQPLVNISS